MIGQIAENAHGPWKVQATRFLWWDNSSDPAARSTVAWTKLHYTFLGPVDIQDAGSSGGPEYVSCLRQHEMPLTKAADTQAGERQFGRKAQLSNITAAKTYGHSLANTR